jgi:oligopeptidase A
MHNPLLDFSGPPRFADFRVEQVAPAVDTLIAENRALVDEVAADSSPPAWDNVVAPLEAAHDRLRRAWGLVGHLNAVMNSPELREVYNANLPKLSQYYTDLGQHEGLFRRYRALHESPAYAALPAPRRRIVDNELRDFRLGGVELPAQQKARFRAISERLSQLSSRFSDNLLDATNAYSHRVTGRDGLAGLPEDIVEAAAEAARADGASGWKFTLHAPSYLPVMQYADDRALRERMYRAYVTRASEFGAPELDNTPLVAEIVALRREQAQLVGYASYAEYSLAPKMAQSPRQVIDFLRELAARARPYAERDLAELREFAARELGLEELQSWDLMYASEKLRLARYAYSDHEVKQYFPETQVVPGMFRVVETLYGLAIDETEAPRWHPDVRHYSVTERAGGAPLGSFYLDLYARPSKRGGAWMDDAIARRRAAAGIQRPLAYLTCNFPAPVGDKPALFTHDDVLTLFHEFGHGLHHLLTRMEDLAVSGINGVEWDAVELPSQFMENYCWEWEVVRHMTRHVERGEPMPRPLFDKMLAAKNFQSGLQTLRQVEFSLFDMLLHAELEPYRGLDAQQLVERVRSEVAVFTPPPYNRFAQSFSHVFAGGYAAGYYSYKWAEVLSADAYAAFEEQGVLDAALGARFRDEILAVGGSRPALDSFRAFRGREPRIDALLRHSGMTA